MDYRRLGNSGLRVSPLCLGTMNFGPHSTEAESFAIMDAALEAGVQFFDTADVYGWKPGEGVTESILGRWFAQGGLRREKTVLATKVYNPMNRDGVNDPNDVRLLNARKIIRNCERSLERLQTDYIDLYQMHHIDRDCPVDEILMALETLHRQGKIRYIGSSNFAGWDIATFNQEAVHRRSLRLISEQSIYNLENRAIEAEVIPACRHYGLGLIPWSPLAGGLLGGVLEKQKEGRRASEGMQKRIEANRDKLGKWETLCREVGQPPALVALAWLLHNPVVTAPIIGPRTINQFTESLPAIDLQLSKETLGKIDEIFPGPGGEAPLNYAW
ncbi:MAG: aldo/keto reductase [Opitutales bacterium]|nr:aldo/keto reductase [Opitutales bacterium]